MANNREGSSDLTGSVGAARERRAAVASGLLQSEVLQEVYADMDAKEAGAWQQSHVFYRWLGKMGNDFHVRGMNDYAEYWRDELAAREADQAEAERMVEEALAGGAQLQDEQVSAA